MEMRLDNDRLDQPPGQRIKAVRAQLGLSQRQFAKLVGVRQPTLATWETDSKVPSEMAQRFVDLIGTLQPGMDWIRLNTTS